MGATEQLAQFIADLRYQALPTGVAEAAKVAIMDGVGNMLAGARQPLAEKIARYVGDMGGKPVSSVVGWGFKTNPPSAAFANGVYGHCLDFEIQGNPPTHGTSSCLPAALALAEALHISGKTLIVAYTLGWEVQGRLRAASIAATNPAYHPPGLVGPLGGAAAAAKVLGLDAYHTRLALGIAASRTGGLTANTGTMVKSTHPGNAARMGVESALLAQMDFQSNEDVLEAPAGYAEALFNGKMDWTIVTGGLGKTFRLVDPGFDIKRFPTQITMQRPIEAVLNLKQRHGLRAEQIESLTISLRGQGHSGPAPRTGLDGKFSVEYCGAAAMLDGQVNIETFTDARRFAPDMEALLPRVHTSSSPDAQGATAIARLADGRTLREACVDFRGSVGNPMSREERLAKFRYCARQTLSQADTEALLSVLERLEELPDSADLMVMLMKESAARY